MTLTQLPKKINTEHSAYLTTARKALDHAIRCGEYLIEAKGLVKHGEWLAWVDANLEVKERQARKYMQLAEANAKRPFDADMTIDEAAATVAAPRVQKEPESQEGDSDFDIDLDDEEPQAEQDDGMRGFEEYTAEQARKDLSLKASEFLALMDELLSAIEREDYHYNFTPKEEEFILNSLDIAETRIRQLRQKIQVRETAKLRIVS